MAANPAPFSRFEWMIAWRYLRARRAEGGVSTMTWISLIGITLAVFALIATLAVRSGFRAEFVDTILGANAHVTIYSGGNVDQQTGRIDRTIEDYEAMAERVRQVPGVTRVAPLVKGQVMGNARDRSAGVEVFGISLDDLKTIPRIANEETSIGDIEAFPNGIALGGVLARELGVSVGDRIKLISPNGVKTALGSSPRVNAYEVVYVFEAGRYDIDKIRAYLPFEEAQSFFNREGRADELEVMLEEPEALEAMAGPLRQAAGNSAVMVSPQTNVPRDEMQPGRMSKAEEALTEQHMLTHKPSNPKCPICTEGKSRNAKSHKNAFQRELTELGQVVTLDHTHMLDKDFENEVFGAKD